MTNILVREKFPQPIQIQLSEKTNNFSLHFYNLHQLFNNVKKNKSQRFSICEAMDSQKRVYLNLFKVITYIHSYIVNAFTGSKHC